MANDRFVLRSNKLLLMVRAFTWDLFFFYTFSVLFLINIKGFSESDIMFCSAVVAVVPIIFQLPVNLIAKKIGHLSSLRSGAICLLVFTVFILIFNNIVLLYLDYVILAIGYMLIVPNLTTLSINNLKAEGKQEQFSKIEGRGAGIYYLINAVGSVGLGYLFGVNPYLTMSFPILASGICVILTFLLKDEQKLIKKDSLNTELVAQEKTGKIEQGVLNKGKSFSLPLIYVILVSLSFYGLVMIESNVKTLLFQEIFLSAVAIGWINFGISIARSIACEVYKFFKSKSKVFITLMPVCYISLLLILALFFVTINNILVLQILVVLVTFLLPFFNEPFKVGTKDYIRQFVSDDRQMDAYSWLFIVRNVGRLVYSVFVGVLLTGMVISSSLLYLSFLALGIYISVQLTFFIIKKVSEKKKKKNNDYCLK